MTTAKLPEQLDTAAKAYPTYPELLSWLVDGNGQENAVRRQRLAELRRECLVRPAIFVGAGTCGLARAPRQRSTPSENIWTSTISRST